MAVITGVVREKESDGTVVIYGPMGSGDITALLGINEGATDVAVQIYGGSLGGATVRVRGSLSGDILSAVDDAYGVQMEYTAFPAIKPVGPAVQHILVDIVGGTASGVFVEIYLARRAR